MGINCQNAIHLPLSCRGSLCRGQTRQTNGSFQCGRVVRQILQEFALRWKAHHLGWHDESPAKAQMWAKCSASVYLDWSTFSDAYKLVLVVVVEIELTYFCDVPLEDIKNFACSFDEILNFSICLVYCGLFLLLFRILEDYGKDQPRKRNLRI